MDYLAHHGILGQKWGKRNGPPYPLDVSDHSTAEKKARQTNGSVNKKEVRANEKATKKLYKQLRKDNFNITDNQYANNKFAKKIASDERIKKADKKLKSTNADNGYEYDPLTDKDLIKKAKREFKKEFKREFNSELKYDNYALNTILYDLDDKYGKSTKLNKKSDFEKELPTYNKTISNVVKEYIGKYADKPVTWAGHYSANSNVQETVELIVKNILKE